MVKITAKDVRKRVRELKGIIEAYKKEHPKKDRDYAEYEREFKRRLKKAIRNLDKLISESVRNVNVFYRHKDRHSLSLKKRIIKEIDACGDATGYSLTITKHYSSYVQKLKDKAKEQTTEKKTFVYNFALMDLKTKMYVCYGSSLRSEKEAFDRAMQMLRNIDVKINSIRLDRYYSCPVYVSQFGESKVYIIPKKTVNLEHGAKWTETMGRFLCDTIKYLEEYFKRNNSESGWASDKKMFGWKISQKRYDRMDVALLVRMVWHNLILIYK